MRLAGFTITRFQFARDRIVGDSQVRAEQVNVAAIELVDDLGNRGLGFAQSLFAPLPCADEISRVFAVEVWPDLEGQYPLGLVHRVNQHRGGNHRAYSLPFEEAVQVALWDLAAKQAGLPLHIMLGSRRDRVRTYASGLDFHLSDAEFIEFFGQADALGYGAFKIKVGHPDFERDLHRLDLLSRTVRPGAEIMIDANEAWGAKEAIVKLGLIEKAGYKLHWVEDPILRNDFDGLKLLRKSVPRTRINAGEYLDVAGKRALLLAGATDVLNVHGQITDVMRIGWLATEMGIPVSVGNTFLEIGVHAACALPEIGWLEYSFQNFDHLVEEPMVIRDGWTIAPTRPGHGLVLSETARRDWSRPEIVADGQIELPPLAAVPDPTEREAVAK
jgi:L-alanine-DL-glutamate epimerase-like enolase superfamily enzyme